MPCNLYRKEKAVPVVTKTVGEPREDGRKNYKFHCADGSVFLCEPQKGQKWSINGEVFKSKRAAKDAVEADEVKDLAAEPLDDLFGDDGPIEGPPAEKKATLFECVHPCAHLVRAIVAGKIELTPDIRETLDNTGWLDPTGEPDTDQADRDFDRFSPF